ncbi:N-formylglutamate amidohydrolase [Sphingomonas qomolangmaensis]|uniref:N-formylglutamate amidohydrolase n=1 Tax=Sphingomonas qomolangmaensis TaxID=2918765 RepID=A0ABY5L9K5_9SPHN|nr:N-formylglutamate amidohydrolase [Sphingomonas qomolangmaensis]UUL82733.1 N-formylglutamate amidohydrolase [Sphingomonas qomolangmaensis]
MTSSTASPSFDRFGPAEPASPVVLSVPHAGREYPAAMLAAIRLPLAALLPLEDRHVDSIAHAARRNETMLVARRARAWIDLNRSEDERDRRIDEGVSASMMPFESAKLKGGLGLVPRRAGVSGDVWRRRLRGDEVMARIVADHRPYHAALAAALAAARRRFGVAVLLDIHSMPTLAGEAPARIVLGDRFGQSAAAPYLARIEGAAAVSGLRIATNAPYAGGHILDAHGAPAAGIHAVQIEFDRTLYLDPMTLTPNAGAQRLGHILRTMIDALLDEITPVAAAAE